MYVYRAYFKANLMQRIINNYLVKNSKFCIHDTTLFNANIISDEKLLHTNVVSMFSIHGHTSWRKIPILTKISTYIFIIGPN